ncbi:MAG: sigma 54-interacting transcriptional regulator [Bacillota bacterium]|nr:sigma 54-interacting transcriptional regulator [Bacillota bacterium]
MLKFNNVEMSYVDSVLIIDKHYNVVHALRFNPRFDNDVNENIYNEYNDKNFFEVYASVKRNESSIVECMETGKVISRKDQIFVDYKGNIFNTNNITMPIIKKGEIVGVIEISQDITSIENDENIRKLKKNNINKSKYNDEIDGITFEDIISINTEMHENIRKAKIYSENKNPLLIYGETGTGKELFARAIGNSIVKDKSKFITQNCAAIPENLFESLLFGVEKGAYTGAEKSEGLFQLADGGVLFLDEINSMPLNLQAKLLRVMQDKKVRAIGSRKEKRIDVKIITAMNITPEKALKTKKLREDLFYRLSSSMINIPPLRDRIEDVPVYVNEFIRYYNNVYRKSVRGVSKELMNYFVNYNWNGNIRELKHILESIISTSKQDILEYENLPIYMKKKLHPETKNNENLEKVQFSSLRGTLEKVERDMIIKALAFSGGKIKKSAELLKIPRQTLKYKIDKLKIDINSYKRQ